MQGELKSDPKLVGEKCLLPAQNYANDVVCSLRDVCLERGIPMPTIVTESGRALASHHAVMVFDVVAR